jgi:hypothetical protein
MDRIAPEYILHKENKRGDGSETEAEREYTVQ